MTPMLPASPKARMSWWARRTRTRLTRSNPYVERARHNAGLSLVLFEARPLPLPHGASVRDFPGPLPEAARPKKLGFERLGAWKGDGGKQGLAVHSEIRSALAISLFENRRTASCKM